MSTESFSKLALLAQQILETRGTSAKIKLAAEYFRNLESDEDLKLAAQFLGEGAFSDVSGKRASVGHRTIAVQAAEFCEIDYEMTDKIMAKQCKSIAKRLRNDLETIAK